MIESVVILARNSNQILPMSGMDEAEDPSQTLMEPSGNFAPLDLDAWESEKGPAPVETDLELLAASQAQFSALSAHEPIDQSAGWEDFEALLPGRASPLARSDDAEERSKLRLLLLRAIREGSIPRNDVHDHCANLDGTTNEDDEHFLSMVVNDLGAEVDERFEYENSDENFKVTIVPDETTEEELAVDEAMTAIDAAASRRSDPLRMYQREFQRFNLLTAQEEIELGQAMETAILEAMDALCGWPDGIQRIVAEISDADLQSSNPGDSESTEADHEEEITAEEVSTSTVRMVDAEATFDDGYGIYPGGDELAETMPSSSLSMQIEAAIARESNPENQTLLRKALTAIRANPRLLTKLAEGDLSCEAARRFASAAADHMAARDRMTKANLKLAFHVAKKHLRSGELLDDLTQEANIGLLKAVDRYDWRRGFRFSTYATWWIRQQVSRHVADKCRTIRFPVHIHDKLQSLHRQSQRFESDYGRAPTIDELASALDLPPRKTAALLRLPEEPSSINADEIDAYIAIESREDFVSPDPADIIQYSELQGAMDSLLAILSKKEQQIIRLRFGLGDMAPLTLDEVGRRFELTRERIRQIESRAIKRLALHNAMGSDPMSPNKRGRPRKASNSTDAAQAEDLDEPPTQELARPTDIDALLDLARKLDLRVEDRRNGVGAMVWVLLNEAPKGSIKLIVPWLEEFGFKLWPGKGYWQ